jgi:hypothetical protein
VLSIVLSATWAQIPDSFDIKAKEQVIIISDKVGAAIDPRERDYYKILPAIKNFKSAVYLQLPDSGYALEIISEVNGIEKKLRIAQSVEDIQKARNYFNAFKPNIAQPQEFKKTSNPIDYNLWFTIGEGWSSEEFGVVMGAAYQKKARSIGLRFTGNFSWTNNMEDFSLIYGFISKRRAGYKSFGTGISYVWDDDDGDGKYVHTVGIPLEAQFFWTPLPFAGIGLYIHLDINKNKPFGGLLLSLQLGKLM